MIKRTLPLLGLVVLLGLPALAHPFNKHGGGAGVGGGPPGLLSSTIPFVNDGGSTTVAGTPTQSFMQGFRDGDLCGGAAPVFKDGVTVQPFSASPANARRYYSSGCLMWAVFQLRPTFTVAAGATKNIAVTGGGSWPSMGSGTAGQTRTLAEVYNQHLSLNLPSGISGLTTGAWLNGDSNQYRVVKWLDGDAGTTWKISTNAAPTEGGTKHGQIVADFYIQALSDGSNALGGYRFLGNVRQPFYNNDTPAKNQYAFAAPNSGTPASGTNWTVNPALGGAVAHDLSWPYGPASQAFTVSGGVATTTAVNTLYQGTPGAGNVTPVVVNCSGTCPTGLVDGGFYWALSSYDGHTFQFSFVAGGNSLVSIGATGSGTISPVAYSNTFHRLTFAGPDAKYLFFQGTGSIAAETTLRTQMDKNYLSSTGLIPPYDLTLTGAQVPVPSFGYSWGPYSTGNLEQAQSAAGDQFSLGPLPNDFAVDFINQTAVSDKIVRMDGLSEALQVYDFKRYDPGNSDHDSIPVLTFPNTYTGLMAEDVSLAWGGFNGIGSAGVGFTAPSTSSAIGYDTSILEHKPRYAAGAYLKTGELQYLDYQVAESLAGILSEPYGFKNPAFPTQRYGICVAWGDSDQPEYRVVAWCLNDLEFAALVYPFDPNNATGLTYDGTQTGKYLNDLANDNESHMLDAFNPANNYYDQLTPLPGGSATTFSIARGYWTPYTTAGLSAGYLGDGPEWEFQYLDFGLAWGTARQSANAKTLLQKTATRQKYILDHYGGYHLYGYYNLGSLHGQATVHKYSDVLNSDSIYSINMLDAWINGGSPAITSFVSPTSGAYWQHTGSISHYTPGNGDIMVMEFGYPSGYDQQSYTIRDYNGVTGRFNLYLTSSCTPGVNCPGAVVAPTSSVVMNSAGMFYYRSVANLPANNFPYTPDYPSIIRGGSAWRQALLGGDANSAAVEADAANRLANDSGGPSTIYLWGARWALHHCFHGQPGCDQ